MARMRREHSDVDNADGLVVPADFGTPGLLTIERTFDQAPAGSVVIDIGSCDPGVEHDVLVVNGQTARGGVLEVELINNFDSL